MIIRKGENKEQEGRKLLKIVVLWLFFLWLPQNLETTFDSSQSDLLPEERDLAGKFLVVEEQFCEHWWGISLTPDPRKHQWCQVIPVHFSIQKCTKLLKRHKHLTLTKRKEWLLENLGKKRVMIKSKGESKGREEKTLETSLNDQQTSAICESWNLFWKIVCMEFEVWWRPMEKSRGSFRSLRCSVMSRQYSLILYPFCS